MDFQCKVASVSSLFTTLSDLWLIASIPHCSLTLLLSHGILNLSLATVLLLLLLLLSIIAIIKPILNAKKNCSNPTSIVMLDHYHIHCTCTFYALLLSHLLYLCFYHVFVVFVKTALQVYYNAIWHQSRPQVVTPYPRYQPHPRIVMASEQ